MKILDTQTGTIHEYGTDGHDSLHVSQDGRYLTYYNLQNGDGSGVGDYRFVCDDDKIPAESETADAIHAHVFFNIGGWNKRPQGECRTCRHRDPEDKKCDCGGLERQGCPFPVSDNYFCKFYEKGGAENDIT